MGVWQHADGLDMLHDLQAAVSEYIGWLQLEANRSPNTVRAYQSELARLTSFLAANGHSLALGDLRHEDLRAYQRHLAGHLKGPASRARALVAIRSWLRWLAREGFMERDLSNGITLPKLEQRLPKPIDPDELARLLADLPRSTLSEKRDRALVQFLISTGCRISEALALDRTDFPRTGNRLIVTGKGSKQRAVYLTTDARAALEEDLVGREDACMALFVNFDRSVQDDRGRRLTGAGARFIVRRLRKELGAWSFKSPHVARHTTATTLLEVTGPTAATRSSWTARSLRKLSPRSGQLLAQVDLELSHGAVERRRQPPGDDLLQRRRQQLLQLCHRLVGAGEVEALVGDGAHLPIDEPYDRSHVGLDPVLLPALKLRVLVAAGLDVLDVHTLDVVLGNDLVEDRCKGLRLFFVGHHDQRRWMLPEQELEGCEQRRIHLEPLFGCLGETDQPQQALGFVRERGHEGGLDGANDRKLRFDSRELAIDHLPVFIAQLVPMLVDDALEL